MIDLPKKILIKMQNLKHSKNSFDIYLFNNFLLAGPLIHFNINEHGSQSLVCLP